MTAYTNLVGSDTSQNESVSGSTLHMGSGSSRLDIEVIQREAGVAWTLRLTLMGAPYLAAGVEAPT